MKEDVITPRLAITTDSAGHFQAIDSKSNTGVTYFIRRDDGAGIYAECVSLDEWWYTPVIPTERLFLIAFRTDSKVAVVFEDTGCRFFNFGFGRRSRKTLANRP